MGISQQIGASSLIKAGVIDNTAARPASPYEGQVIFQKDTDQMLVWNGTAWVIPNSPAQNPAGLELISSTTVGTAVSTVTVSSAFSTTYDAYRIIYTNGLASVSSIGINMKLGSVVTGYYSSAVFGNYSTSAVTGVGQDNQAIFNNVGGVSSSGFAFLDCNVYEPFLTRWTHFSSREVHYGLNFGSANGLNVSSTSITDFTLSPTSGTLTGGTVTVYGYRK